MALGVAVLCSPACGSPTRDLGGGIGAGSPGDAAGSAGTVATGGAGKAGGSAGHPGWAGDAAADGTAGDQPSVGTGGTDAGGGALGALGGAPSAGAGGAIGGAGAAGNLGKGGSGGSGGAAGKAIGSQCSGNGECQLGFCADGVCCENACTGACKQCSPAGLCNVTPADDAACGAIACPANTGCRSYQALINRCASFGVCKTAVACTFTAKPTRTPCTSPAGGLCDAAATCTVPSVNCGGTPCAVNGSVCCGTAVGNLDAFSCVARAGGNECQDMGGPIACDEHADCALGTQCCLTDSPGGFLYSCQTAANCPLVVNFTSYYPICKSLTLTGSPVCAPGTSCVQFSTNSPHSFQVCK